MLFWGKKWRFGDFRVDFGVKGGGFGGVGLDFGVRRGGFGGLGLDFGGKKGDLRFRAGFWGEKRRI